MYQSDISAQREMFLQLTGLLAVPHQQEKFRACGHTNALQNDDVVLG